MRGLLQKDLHMMLRYQRFYFLILLIFVIGFSVSEDALALLLFPLMLLAVVPMNLLSQDEKSGWEHYCGTLPYSRRQLVGVKYLMLLLVFALELLLTAAAQAVAVARRTASWQDFWCNMSLIPLGLLSPCVLLPAIFRLGTERGRLAYYVALILAMALLMLVSRTEAVIALSDVWRFLAALAAGVLLLILSWCLAVRFYQKREL